MASKTEEEKEDRCRLRGNQQVSGPGGPRAIGRMGQDAHEGVAGKGGGVSFLQGKEVSRGVACGERGESRGQVSTFTLEARTSEKLEGPKWGGRGGLQVLPWSVCKEHNDLLEGE